MDTQKPFVVLIGAWAGQTPPPLPAKTESSRSNNCSLFPAARLPDGWEAAQPFRCPDPERCRALIGSGHSVCDGSDAPARVPRLGQAAAGCW